MPEPKPEELLEEVQLLIQRLERISVDSIWARRSSGQRGALLKWADQLEYSLQNPSTRLEQKDLQPLYQLMRTGYMLLGKAAQEKFR
jgi:hypothetical protein